MICWGLLASFALSASVAVEVAQPEVRVLTIDGVINPLSARYLRRELHAAERENAQAVILELNTPGGLESSMREMVQSMMASNIPVIVYVSPQGGRAASAGMFITMAAHVAAMAPGTNIGAAHPVSVGGGTTEKKPEDAAAEKAVSDAAAFARVIARERGRNASWAEQAVRKSVSLTADEAVKRNVVDFVASDRAELMRRLQGKRLSVQAGTRLLEMENVRLVEKPMRLPEKILQAITDPNIAYLLITIGFIGIIAELYNPGMLFPGITGVISLILAFASLGSLPISWAGFILLAIGIALLALEAQDPGIGVFGVGGVVAFILGSLMLYTPVSTPSPSLPRVNVSPWLVGFFGVLFSGFVVAVFVAARTSKRAPVKMGPSSLIGRTGVALTDLAPQGVVRVDSEQWTARIAEGVGESGVRSGDSVEVTGIDGVTLQVQKAKIERAA